MPSAARLLVRGVAVPAARLALPVASRLHPRVRQAAEARRAVLDRWREAARRAADRTPRLWLHASSAGESLQARPLVEALRAASPGAAIFLSYWSTSASRVAGRTPGVDHADLLPFDFPGPTRALVRALEPDALVLIGAETWPNLVWAAADAGVPVAQACARLASSAGRLRWPVSTVTRDVYRRLRAVAAIGEEDAARVRSLGVPAESVAVTGDTRVDATLDRAAAAAAEPPLWSPPAGAGPVLVAGSTHPADEAVLLPAIRALRSRHPGLVAVVAPHDPEPRALAELDARAGREGLATGRLSSLAPGPPPAVVLVDRVGILYRLYAIADVAFVGGAFEGSVHNTMEPAAWGVPIVVGPRPGTFHEVAELEGAGALVRAHGAGSLAAALDAWLADPAARARAGAAARETLERHRGATARTLRFLAGRALPADLSPA